MVDKENFAKDINVPRKEPIMIDGVDVSGCKYLPYCNDKQGNCAFEPNCYFKQHARKTQECEERKEENDRYRKALEEIEKYLQTQLDGFGNDVYEMQKSAINNILDIISRAKEG